MLSYLNSYQDSTYIVYSIYNSYSHNECIRFLLYKEYMTLCSQNIFWQSFITENKINIVFVFLYSLLQKCLPTKNYSTSTFPLREIYLQENSK